MTARRPRQHLAVLACTACRLAKTKCVAAAQGSACQFCVKTEQPCVMPGPKKPRIKPSQKYADLERKVEALTAALAEKTEDRQTPGRLATQAALLDQGQPRPVRGKNDILSRQSNKSPDIAGGDTNGDSDFIKEGAIGLLPAIALFDHWATYMHPLFPFVTPTSLDQLRIEKPLLLLTICTVACSALMPNLRPVLVARLDRELAQRAYIRYQPSQELVQALLMYASFPVSVDCSPRSALTNHCHIATMAAFDLSLNQLGGKTFSDATSQTISAARIWLSLYYAVSSSSILLRRQRLDFDKQTLERARNILMSNGDALPSDRFICSLASIQEIVDDASQSIGAVPVETLTHFPPDPLRLQVDFLARRLEEWCLGSMHNVDGRLQKLLYHSARLRIYHVAVGAYLRKTHGASAGPDYVPMDPPAESCSPSHVAALDICIESCHETLSAFASMETVFVQLLPITYLLWTLSAAVTLTKLAPILEHPSGESTQTSRYPSSVTYFEKVISKLADACDGGYASRAQPILLAMRRLKTMYEQKQRVCMMTNACGPDENHQVETENVLNPSVSKQALRDAEEDSSVSKRPSINAVQPQQPYGEQQFIFEQHSSISMLDDPMIGLGDWMNLPYMEELITDDSFPTWLFAS